MASVNNDTNIEPLDDINLEDYEFEPIDDSEILEQPAEKLDVISVKRENTRGILALAFLIGFFVVLMTSMIIAGLDAENRIDNLKEVILAISGILSGPLGFVIGYYFRSSEEN